MAREYQGEFFDEFHSKDRPLRQLAKKVVRTKRVRAVHLSVERVIFIAILCVFGLILSYALGVETARRYMGGRAEGEGGVARTEVGTDIREYPEVASELTAVSPPREAPVLPDRAGAGKAGMEYTIQLISFKDRRKADAKVAGLTADGMTAFIIRRNQWFQVCAGLYGSKEEARTDLARFSKRYRGCFLRKKDEAL